MSSIPSTPSGGAGSRPPSGSPSSGSPVGGPSDGSPSGDPAGAAPSLDHRQERIRLETPRHRIEGSMTLARDGYRSRVSDVLNASERDFLTLTDVTLQPLSGGAAERHSFLVLARAHIVFAVSADEAPQA